MEKSPENYLYSGECDYNLGKTDTAEQDFNYVIDSYKGEAPEQFDPIISLKRSCISEKSTRIKNPLESRRDIWKKPSVSNPKISRSCRALSSYTRMPAGPDRLQT